jgi:uncharacterized coiled-coil protein SlyX
MQNEYSRQERSATVVSVGQATATSSARVVRGEELDPAVRRRKDAESADTGNRYIEMFCERYRDRGIAGRMHADAAQQEKREALNRAIAPGAYVMTEKLEKASGRGRPDVYRSGVSEGRRYMTVDDFDRYYHDQRGYKFPQYRPAAEARRAARDRMAEMAMADTRVAGGDLQPKKAGWLTDTDRLPAIVERLMKYRFFRALNVWAGETFPRETEVVDAPRKASVRRLVPAGLVATLVTVAVSMSLVIGSTVLVSQSTREVSQLKNRLAEQEEVLDDLGDQLAEKNDALDIEGRAHELGMVKEKYLSGQYLSERPEDYVEIYDESAGGQQSGWSALLSAMGIGTD